MQPSGALTRKKILYASVQVFLKTGCEGATDKEIAALAGISSGSPFGGCSATKRACCASCA